MTDWDSPEERAKLSAKELRLWVTVDETGLWCDRCNLPSVIRFAVRRDPATDSGKRMGMTRCMGCYL